MIERHPGFLLVPTGSTYGTGRQLPATKPKAKPLLPYWVELGYELDPKTGLFHRTYTKADGSVAHEVVVEARQWHSHRLENLGRCLLAKYPNPEFNDPILIARLHLLASRPKPE